MVCGAGYLTAQGPAYLGIVSRQFGLAGRGAAACLAANTPCICHPSACVSAMAYNQLPRLPTAECAAQLQPRNLNFPLEFYTATCESQLL